MFPKGFKQAACDVKVLAVERTFWEKATILHSEFHRPVEKPTELLNRVARHKSLFFKSYWAKYGEAAKGTLKILPSEYRIAALQSDYANMREMFFGEPPKFDSILALLKEWEREFNGK